MIISRGFKAACNVQAAFVVAFLTSFALIGCSEKGPQRVALTGVVLLDGKPLNNASIIFTPKSVGLAAAGEIRNGKFVLGLDDGPTIGEYGVRINPNDAEFEQADPATLSRQNRRPRIPKVYQADGKLSATITGEPNQTITFELTTKP